MEPSNSLTKPVSTSVNSGQLPNGIPMPDEATSGIVAAAAGDEAQLTLGSYVVGSFPTDYQYSADLGVGEDSSAGGARHQAARSYDDDKPKILLMGLRRSGKSSIQKVVFHKMSPNETLFLESTNKIVKDDVSECSFIKFSVWDFPGHIDFFDPMFEFESIFGDAGAIIFVIDAQDDYLESLTKLHITITKAYKINRNIKFEVFIHKCDGLSDDSKIEMQRDVTQRATDDLLDAGFENINIGFHLTTIYDHSVFEAFSKVVQKLIPHMAAFEGLLNIFCSNSALEKAFFFDIASKIYIATDTTAVDMQTYELCCDMIDVVMDVSSIYGCKPSIAAGADAGGAGGSDGVLTTISAGGGAATGQIFSEQTAATIKLNNSTVLYMRGVNRHLALVCVMREEALERQGIIEYNFHCIKKGLLDLLELRSRSNSDAQSSGADAQRLHQLPAMDGALAAGDGSSVAADGTHEQLLHQPPASTAVLG